jgi:hypothetical protein
MKKMVIEKHPKVQSYEDARRFSVKYGKRVWGVYFRVKIDQEGNLSITIDGIGKIGKGFIYESKLKRDASASGDHNVLETLNFIPTKDEKNALKLEDEFHKYLAKRWCPPAISTDGTKGGEEWFNSWSKNPDEAIKEFIEIGKVLLQDKTIGRINFEFKHDTQESDYNMVVEIVDEFGRVLVHFHTAWGKTTASPKWVVDLCEPGDVALFTTPIVETLSSLVEKINGTPRNPAFEYGKEIEVIETKDITDISETISNIEQYKKEGKIVLICLSVQDLRYDDSEKKEEVREIRKKYKALFDKFNIKLWIRDEFHKEYNGPKTIKVFENIKSEKLIDLTAATHKLLFLYGHEYPNPKMIVKRDLLDALYEKKVKKNPDYKDFPDYLLESGPNYETPLCSNEFRDMFTVEEGQTPKKQFRLDDNLNFVYENEVIEYFKRRYDGQGLVGGEYQPLGDRNPYYLGKEHGATLVVLPEGEKNYTATDIQNAAKKVGNTHIKNRLHFTAQDFLNEKKRGFSGNEIQENWLKMAEEQGKDGFNLYVHMQLTTGSDMPPLNSGVINDIIKSPDRFIQTIGRPSRTYPGKDTVKIYLDAPGVVLSTKSMVYQMAKDKAPNDPKKAEELYNCLPITEYMKDGTTRCVTFEEGMKEYNKDMARYCEGTRITPSFINKFPDVLAIIKNMDFEERKFEGIPELGLTGNIGSKTKKKSTSPSRWTGLVTSQPRVETLAVMLTESGKIDVCEGHDTIQSVFKDNPAGMAQQFFGYDNIKMIQAALLHPEFYSSISDWYNRNKEEYKNKSKEDIIKSEKIFTNAKFKEKSGMVYVPKECANEMIDEIKDPNPESILVENALNGMIPVMLRERFPDTRIVCAEYFPYYVDHLRSMGFETYEIRENSKGKLSFLYDDYHKTSLAKAWNNGVFSLLKTYGKKFTYGITNPPYSKGGILLYTKFFELGLDIVNVLIQLMPVNLKSSIDKLKFHNRRVSKHSSFISDDKSDYFNVNMKDIKYVVASLDIENKVIDIENPLDSLPLLYPKRPRLKSIRGDTKCSTVNFTGESVEEGEVITGIYKGDIIGTRNIPKSVIRKSNKWSSRPYLVCVNHTPSRGRFNCAVIKNENMTWSLSVYVFEVDTEEEGNKLKEWLQSKEIISEVNRMFSAKGDNFYTISKEMVDRLPYYE